MDGKENTAALFAAEEKKKKQSIKHTEMTKFGDCNCKLHNRLRQFK